MPVTDRRVTFGVEEPRPARRGLAALLAAVALSAGAAAPQTQPPVVAPPRPADPSKQADPGKKDPETPKKEPEPRTVKLPAMWAEVTVGGGGRYIVLHLPKVRQLAVFDAKEQKVVKYLPVAEETICFAAGREHLFVVNNTAGVMQRWNLTTFAKEATVKLPEEKTYTAACMGSDSAGPLLLCPKPDQFGLAQPVLLNPVTLRPLPTEKDRQLPGTRAGTFRATPDGRLFVWRSEVGAGGGATVAEVSDGKVTAKSFSVDAWAHLIPGPGGRYFYANDGVYSDQLRRVHPDANKARANGAFVPAAHGGLFLHIEPPPTRLPGDTRPAGGPPKAHVYFQGHFTPLGTIQSDLLTHGTDRVVHLLPRYNLLVVIGAVEEVIHLIPFDLEALLAKSEVDYLVVTSDPPLEVAAGQKFEYAPVVRSKKGGVKVKLDAGPDGMTMGADGRLTWDVPVATPRQDVSVILTVTDASGQELFHTFRVVVTERPAPKP